MRSSDENDAARHDGSSPAAPQARESDRLVVPAHSDHDTSAAMAGKEGGRATTAPTEAAAVNAPRTVSSKPRARKRGRNTPRGPAPVANAARFASMRRLAGGAAAALLVGLGMVATGDRELGPWLTAGAFALCVGAAHALGRAGPDPGMTP